MKSYFLAAITYYLFLFNVLLTGPLATNHIPSSFVSALHPRGPFANRNLTMSLLGLKLLADSLCPQDRVNRVWRSKDY